MDSDSKLSSQCPACGSAIYSELSKQALVSTQSEQKQVYHPNLLGERRVKRGRKVKRNSGDIEVPEIFTDDEEERPLTIVPVKTQPTEHPKKKFANNLVNNRWLNNNRFYLSRPLSHRPSNNHNSEFSDIRKIQIPCGTYRNTESTKNEITPIKKTINLVERVRNCSLKVHLE